MVLQPVFWSMFYSNIVALSVIEQITYIFSQCLHLLQVFIRDPKENGPLAVSEGNSKRASGKF